MALAEVTPYSTLGDEYTKELPQWVPNEQDRLRLNAYTIYEAMYWSVEEAFELIRRDEDGPDLYIPKPKIIVDTTAHYLLKGMKVKPADPEKNGELDLFLDAFVKRERFYSRFQVAKLSGVTRGDWVFHLTADPLKEEGSRISLTSVDPALYFPEFDADDMEIRTGAKLVEPGIHPDDPSKMAVRVLRYWFEIDPVTKQKTSPFVWRQEDIWETDNWSDPKKAKKVRSVIPPSPLPNDITKIPLYHFKNAEWQGYDFGNSELKGYERIFKGINQAMSDTEISLALVGLGVYATDAGRPKDSSGRETDWEVVPGTVWEMPGATMVKRLEGITTVTPVIDFITYLGDSVLEGSGTTDVALGRIDAQVAESGIALALKFLPTLAKIEYRDTAGVEILQQLWYDWKFWVLAYEGQNYTETELLVTLAEKLPINREKLFLELNNMLDRKVISREYYRQQVEVRLDYVFPTDMQEQVIAEDVAMAVAMLETQQQFAPSEEQGDSDQQGPGGRTVGAGDTKEKAAKNKSNNAGKENESKGTEVPSKA